MRPCRGLALRPTPNAAAIAALGVSPLELEWAAAAAAAVVAGGLVAAVMEGLAVGDGVPLHPINQKKNKEFSAARRRATGESEHTHLGGERRAAEDGVAVRPVTFISRKLRAKQHHNSMP